ncbi:MAG: hypothetical protein WCR79_01745 [Fusobacterium sp.]
MNNKKVYKDKREQKIKVVSTDFIERITIKKELDPIEAAEQERDSYNKKAYSEAISKIIPIIVGRENYIKYFLFKVQGIRCEILAKRFGITQPALSLCVSRTEKKISKIINQLNNNKELFSTLQSLTYDLKKVEQETKYVAQGAGTDYTFDFEVSEKEYFHNMRMTEKELKMPIFGRDY